MSSTSVRRIRNLDGLPEFSTPRPVMAPADADGIVTAALSQWDAATEAEARRRHETLLSEFPDQAPPDSFWHSAASLTFKEFFTWGHDQDFGHGISRSGAMGSRHSEIVGELLTHGMLPTNLKGRRVLDIGCWSGGDVLLLSGLGADVTALEEHPIAAAAARRLCNIVGCDADIVSGSLYRDRQDWHQGFDLIYCAGVVYHVTDPLLFLRICFAYLRPGGRIVLETKFMEGPGSFCEHAGTLEKGWNWFSPTREAFGRWLVDVGFDPDSTELYQRPVGRLLAASIKSEARRLPESAGFSRPGSWLEDEV